MLRRSLLSLAAAAMGSSVATTRSGAGKTPPSSAMTATVEPHQQVKVEVADPPPSNFVPPASEAPELLQAYVEPKPFVSPRRVQLFAVSAAVGATTVAVIYFLISKSISLNAEGDQEHVDTIVAVNRLATEERAKLFPEFAAPSSYDQLQAKMEQHEREMARQEEQVYSATSMLNTEIVYHVKMWWNRCLTNVQNAVDHMAAAQEKRRQHRIKANIEATLRYSGYELVELKRES